MFAFAASIFPNNIAYPVPDFGTGYVYMVLAVRLLAKSMM